MKKCIISIIALSLMLSLIAFSQPAFAAEPNTINLSDLEEGQVLEIYEDSVLNIDTDKRLSQIKVHYCDLTIKGSETLTLDDNEYNENSGILSFGSGKITINSGSITSNDSLIGNYIINGGTIKINGQTVEMNDNSISSPRGFRKWDDNGYFIMNDGIVCASEILYSGKDSSVTINGGHIECAGDIVAATINIGENEYVTSPWNSVPSESFDSTIYHHPLLSLGEDHYGSIKVIPKSEINFIEGISISESACTLSKGEHKQLSVSFSPEDVTNKNVTWSSSDNNVANVSDDGVVTGFGSGTAVITAKSEDGNFEATCEITVSDSNEGKIREGLKIEFSDYSSDTKKPTIKVSYNGYILKEGNDYTINYDNDNDAPGVTIVIPA